MLTENVSQFMDNLIEQITNNSNSQREFIEDIGNQKNLTFENGISYFKKYSQFLQQKSSLQHPTLLTNSICIQR
jgi:hypothetical protein